MVVADRGRHLGVGDANAQIPPVLVDECPRHHALQAAVQDAERGRLAPVQRGAELLAEGTTVHLEGAVDLVERHLDVADPHGDGRVRLAEERVTDAPDGKAGDQEQKKRADEPAVGAFAHRIEHDGRNL